MITITKIKFTIIAESACDLHFRVGNHDMGVQKLVKGDNEFELEFDANDDVVKNSSDGKSVYFQIQNSVYNYGGNRYEEAIPKWTVENVKLLLSGK